MAPHRYYSTVVSVLILLRPTATSPTSFPSSSVAHEQVGGPFSANVIVNFLRNRCGSHDPHESPAIWSYEGTLTDPVTGRVIADVEGLELVKKLPMIERSRLSDGEQIILNDLPAASILTSRESSTLQWDAANTILSRRLFCYRRRSPSPDEVIHRNQLLDTKKFSPYNSLLTSLRLRPDGPLRHLSSSESVAVYDCAITFISRNNGKEMVIISERGGVTENEDCKNEYLIGLVQGSPSSSDDSFPTFDFAIHAQRKFDSERPVLPPLKLYHQTGSEDGVVNPPRSRLVQFGKGDGGGSLSGPKYGSVREMYSYSFNHAIEKDSVSSSFNEVDPVKFSLLVRIRNQMGIGRPKMESSEPKHKCTVRYIRYGESPPWYAPGRSCTLDLRGKRITLPECTNLTNGNVDAANPLGSSNPPSLASWAASKCNFWSGWPAVFSSRDENAEGADLLRRYYQLPPESDSDLVRKAVHLFCNEPRLVLDQIDDYPMPERAMWLGSTENVLSKINSFMRRISKSMIASQLSKP
ncbi:hypothetical protein ACHAXA_001290 [Cyclostephanos tholiformis]|uniref:Uncharacterized protein n=1 Tax=Cyclostephanos tholiformis TaxID=382380 RepID=A0ABD3RQG1_9STRA